MKGLFKKTLLMILTLMLAFTLFACSEDKNGDAEGDGTPSGESGDGQGDMTPLPGAPSDGDGDSVIPSPGNGGADSDTNGSTPGGEGSGEGSGSGESVEGGVGGEVGGEGDFDGPTDSAQGEEAPKKLFVYSKNSDRFHLPTCYHADRIGEDSKVYFEGDAETLAELGYKACTVCKPMGDIPTDEEGEEKPELVIPEGTTYVVNKESKKFHLPSCHFSSSMKEENREFSTLSYSELSDAGYSHCSSCLGDEDEPNEETEAPTDPDESN